VKSSSKCLCLYILVKTKTNKIKFVFEKQNVYLTNTSTINFNSRFVNIKLAAFRCSSQSLPSALKMPYASCEQQQPNQQTPHLLQEEDRSIRASNKNVLQNKPTLANTHKHYQRPFLIFVCIFQNVFVDGGIRRDEHDGRQKGSLHSAHAGFSKLSNNHIIKIIQVLQEEHHAIEKRNAQRERDTQSPQSHVGLHVLNHHKQNQQQKKNQK
jgi:hypothetical protein